MMLRHFLLSAWEWDPSIIIGCAILLIAYLVLIGSRFNKRSLYYLLGLAIFFLALVSPLDELGDEYLFSAHMLQHILFILVVPPLLILGIPKWLAEKGMKYAFFRKTEHFFNRPLIAWIAAAGAMWFWHAPPIFNAALANETIHIIQHLSLVVAGTIFWWYVIDPLKENDTHPLSMVLFLFTACIACTLLGILIAYSSPGIYPAYLNPADPWGILPILRNQWGLSPLADLQIGGLLMWVPACFIYITGIIGLLVRWYSEKEEVELPAPKPQTNSLNLADNNKSEIREKTNERSE
ncbi:MAG: cytochrome c oxidase assembly protein [Calditrichia bacterium]